MNCYSLCLFLRSPMMSWGVADKNNNRGTYRHPTKSAILGIVCSSMGLSGKNGDIDEINRISRSINVSFRIDEPGLILKDDHNVTNVENLDGSKNPHAVLTDRFYLREAQFFASLESEDKNLLEEINEYIKNPKWFVYFGRKCCTPTDWVFDPRGVQELSSLENLRSRPYILPERYKNMKESKTRKVEIVYQSDNMQGECVEDDFLYVSSERKHYFNRYLNSCTLDCSLQTTSLDYFS